MPDGEIRLRGSLRSWTILLFVVAACSNNSKEQSQGSSTATVGSSAAVTASAPAPVCPATGEWAPCSVMYRLVRAGLAPKVDSGATPDEKSLRGQPLVIKIGLSAKLEVFLYRDSAARAADESHLDRSQLVTSAQPQTIRRERTLIENANLVGLLTSINDHQRERVSDALTAGPPQPATP